MTDRITSQRQRQRRALLAASALMAASSWPTARAQPGGGRALRVLVAAPPGGTPDVIARAFAGHLGGGTGMFVENRPGAAGLIAVGALKQAIADGGAALLGHAGLVTMYPYLHARLPYEPARDLVPVALAAETAFGLAVGPAVPPEVRSLADYTLWARGDATRATYGTPGIGTLAHVLGALLAKTAGFEARHVAYGGGPQAIGDLVGGRLSSVVLPDGLLRPLHESARLRILVTSGARRQPALPGVPTLVDEGFKSLVMHEWWGFFVPHGTPTSIIDALATELAAAASALALSGALSALGLRTLVGNAGAMADRIAREKAHWQEVLPGAGIRMD